MWSFEPIYDKGSLLCHILPTLKSPVVIALGNIHSIYIQIDLIKIPLYHVKAIYSYPYPLV